MIDVSGAVLLLAVAGPVVLGLALLVRFRLGPPVLFRQQRLGRQGRVFTLYKLRSMTDTRDAQGRLLPDAMRLTRLGHFLRSTSLDEVPQLWNVLRGDMSLVGPRPLYPIYWDRYTDEQRRRHDVKPGLTGWAQINGRNDLTWSDKFALDVWYVDHQSLGLDLKILAMTGWRVLRREGISQPGHVTASEFMGSAEAPGPPIESSGGI